MCVCVLEILVLKIFCIERLFWDFFVCWLDHWLNCMLDCIHVCVFYISKNCFEKLARHLLNTLLSVELLKPFLTQSRHLLDTWWIDRESSCLLDSSSTPGGSIEHLFLNMILCFSILARYLNYRQPVSRHIPRQLPRHLPIPQLSSITEGSIYSSIAILLSFLWSL